MLREELSFLSPRFHANINSHYDACPRKGHRSPCIACVYHLPQAGVSPPQVCIMYSCSPHRQAPFHPPGVHHVTPTPRHATCAPPPQVCIMRRLEHPGIIRLKDVFVKPAATGTSRWGARAARGAFGARGGMPGPCLPVWGGNNKMPHFPCASRSGHCVRDFPT